MSTTIAGSWIETPQAPHQHYFKRDCRRAMCGRFRQGGTYTQEPAAPCAKCADHLRREEERRKGVGR